MKKITRYIGYNKIEEISEIIQKYKNDLNSQVIINMSLQNNLNMDIAYKIKDIISNTLEIDKIKLKNILIEDKVNNVEIENILKICEIYKNNNSNISADMLSNFLNRMIGWLKVYRGDNNKNKFLYFGDIKKNEMYFLILLGLLDVEVIYIDTIRTDKFNKINEINEYSICIQGEQSKEFDDNEINSSIKKGKLNLNRTSNQNVNLESSRNISQGSDKELNEFINEIKNNTINNFYNGFIGSSISKENYENALFELKECLENKYMLLQVTNGILPLSNDEIQLINQKTNNNIDKLENYKSIFKNEVNNNSAYEDIINDFSKNNVQKSRIENFALKLLVWAIRIKDFILCTDKDKVLLYFGDIKSHEIYFLKLLKYLNINIIYIYDNREYNKELNTILEIALSIGNNFYGINEYPSKIIREVETNAFVASRTIDNMLYNSDTGMYRPYSLNEKEVKSVILRTTLEEAFLLWVEPSKFRSGFKNENNKVNIPTLLFKINGVNEDINKYWLNVNKLCDNKNTILIKETNFYKSSYSNQEFYRGSYLLTKDKLIDRDKIKESSFYKFSYLDKDLQENIIEKIDEVITCGCFLFSKDSDFSVRVVMTILDLEERFIKLLQSYNIGESVPKIILYNNNKDQYSKEDSIIIMFMSLMGFDIAILNPTGYVNIENLIDENIIPRFKLEKIEYDLCIPQNIEKLKDKKSILKRIFKF